MHYNPAHLKMVLQCNCISGTDLLRQIFLSII